MTDQTSGPISGRWGIPKGFDHTNVPNFILEHYASLGVSNIQLALIIHLASFRYDSDKTQGSRPSINTLAELMGLSYKSVLTHLQKLHEDGWVIIHSGKAEGKPSEYDFSPLTLKCFELAKQGGMKKDSYPRSEKRFRGIRYQGLKKISHKEKALKQEKKEQEQNAYSPFSNLSGDSPQITDYEPDEPKKAAQPKPKKEPPHSAPPPPTESPAWLEPDGPKVYAPLANSLPRKWTATHLHIYLNWLKKPNNKPLYPTGKQQVEGIYKAFYDTLQEHPLATAIDTFVGWYYKSEQVADMASKKPMTKPTDITLPGAERLASYWLGEWQATKTPAAPTYYPAQEQDVYQRVERGVGIGLGRASNG